MLKQYGIRKFLWDYDFKLIFFVLSLSTLGIYAIGSANKAVQSRQAMGMMGGIVIMLIVSLIDYHFVLKFYRLIYVFNLILLILVRYSNYGDDAKGARRWLDLKIIRFQPSELAKILLILFFAQYIMLNRTKLNSFRHIFTAIVLIAIPAALIYKQPDLSTTIMVMILFVVILYIGGISHKLVLGTLAVIIPLAVISFVLVLQPNQTIIKDYQQNRILAWLYPDEYADTEAYQQNNSKMAIGSGQLYGKGYNNNEVGSVKNGKFISEPEADFIFAVIGEEWGFLGCCMFILLLFLISMECVLIGWKAKDLAGHIIAGGMAALVCFQSFINIGVATGLLPNTGIPLPFVSYGMTSLVSLFIGIGFVLNVRLQSRRNYGS